MDYYQELACLTNLRDKAMDVITWRIKYEYTKFQTSDVHFNGDPFYMQVAILRTWHLVDKVAKWPRIGKNVQY
jgi:hypothetical protein